jgi:hypothetical protein
MFTEKELRESKDFQKWTKGLIEVLLTLQPDNDCVLWVGTNSDSSSYTVLRFWKKDGMKISKEVMKSRKDFEGIFNVSVEARDTSYDMAMVLLGQGKHDAFGTPIVVGKRYGYSRNKNGSTTTFYGTVEKVTAEGNASIKVENRYNAIYSNNVESDGKGPYRNVSVKCNMLIPYGNYNGYSRITDGSDSTRVGYRTEGIINGVNGISVGRPAGLLAGTFSDEVIGIAPGNHGDFPSNIENPGSWGDFKPDGFPSMLGTFKDDAGNVYKDLKMRPNEEKNVPTLTDEISSATDTLQKLADKYGVTTETLADKYGVTIETVLDIIRL